MKKIPVIFENISDKGNFVLKQNNVPLQSGALVDENSELEINVIPIEGYDYKVTIDNSETVNTKIVVTEPIYAYSNDIEAPMPGEPEPQPEPVQPKMFINALNTVKEDTNFDIELDLFPADFGNELCVIHGHIDVIPGTKLTVDNQEITIENNGEFTIGSTSGIKLSEIGNKIIKTVVALVGTINFKFELLKASDLTIISSVEKSISIVKNDQKILPELVLNFPDDIVVDEEFDFNVQTIPNDDEHEMVLVRGIINNYQNVEVKYLNVTSGNYEIMPYESDGTFIFGPKATGFPLQDLTSLFKSIIKETGDYTIKIELYKFSDGEVLATISKQFEVKNAGGGEDPKPEDEFIEDFKKLTEHDANYSWIISSQYFNDGLTMDNIKKFYIEYFKYYQCRDLTDYLVKDLCEKQFGTIEEIEQNTEESK